jgi:hypothetical protein
MNYLDKKLLKVGAEYVCFEPGELSYLVRHSFRERIFEFKSPYPNEQLEFDRTLSELIEIAVCAGWFKAATNSEIVNQWAKVEDLKKVLLALKLPVSGKRSELLNACLNACPEWAVEFAKNRPGYQVLINGQIELQATRPVAVTQTGRTHRKAMREFFDRDLNSARQEACIIGMKIWHRDDLHWADKPCAIGLKLCGLYLPDEVPELYSEICPEEYCCCLNREMVLRGDASADEENLIRRLSERKNKV